MAQKVFNVDHPNYILDTLAEIAQEKGFKFTHNNLDGNDWSPKYCHLDFKGFQSNFQLQQMPGCCAVLVLSYVRIRPFAYKNFDMIVSLVEDAAKDAGFGSVAMTQVVPTFSPMFWDKEPWIKCLDRGWLTSKAFRNAKSGNLVTYLTKDLEQPGKVKGLEVRVEN